jgi:D-proline reductase (dithiol) PrdB
VPRLDDLSEVVRKTLLGLPCFDKDDAPATLLAKPLSESKLALVTSAGVHMRGDKPFGGGDQSFRAFASDARAQDIIQSHTSIGFDRSGFMDDMNISVPLDRLRELREQGVIGSLAETFYSFMGAQRDPRQIADETAPEVARLLVAAGVDVVVLTPS